MNQNEIYAMHELSQQLKANGPALAQLAQYMPIIEEVAKEKNIPLYYIDTDALTSDEMNKLSTTNSYLKKNKWGTPTTLFMLGNRVLESIGGYVEKDSVLSFLDGKVVMGE